ncbi:MAG: tRNA (adenosine(37)-N6)-threonylcarbamoyltransferase complex dimerization subunit type 1 TsaB [Gammaproteobacteria bacterium]|nr:tRNA (adenosine(37)-N6)-threonylcarbamoyltransferase complex dimerization subunit type 1 TsaB [Gammaproteobacteria bacterium]
MKLLAIDTSTEACSAALLIGTEVREHFKTAPREHAKLILPMVDGLLVEAGLSLSQLDAIAFGRGPGSFTGLRIATGVVQGLAFGADLPVLPVSTLAALAQGAHTDLGLTHVLATLDARMSEVYWGVYQINNAGMMELHGAEQVCAPGEVALPLDGEWLGAGSGWKEYGAALRERCGTLVYTVMPERLPRARDVALLGVAALQRGLAVSAGQAMPVYLRNQVAWAKCE